MLNFVMHRNDIIERTREFRREIDVIKQRVTRVCNLVKTLLDVIVSLFHSSAFTSVFLHRISPSLQNSDVRAITISGNNSSKIHTLELRSTGIPA